MPFLWYPQSSPESFRRGWGPEVASFGGKLYLGTKTKQKETGVQERDKRKPQGDRVEDREQGRWELEMSKKLIS